MEYYKAKKKTEYKNRVITHAKWIWQNQITYNKTGNRPKETTQKGYRTALNKQTK